MKKHVTFAVATAALLAAVAAWAAEQPRSTPRADKPAGRVAVDERPRPTGLPSLPDAGDTHRLILIDDVDKEAQRKAAQREARRKAAEQEAGKPKAVRRVEGRPVRRLDIGQVGRYAVAASEECMILVDTTTGKTWLLCPSASGNPAEAAWLPIQRIDHTEEALRWMNRQKVMKDVMKERAARERRKDR